MSVGNVSGHHAVPPKKDYEGLEAGGAYMAQVQPQTPQIFGDTGVALTEKQKNVSLFC